MVSGIADGLEEPEKKREQLRSTRNEDEFSEHPPHKPTLLELSEMTEEEAAKALRNYQIVRKRWTDKRLRERRSKLSGSTSQEFTGDHSPTLRLMSDVHLNRLKERDTFADKETVRLQIAEEANLRGICIFTIRSDKQVLEVVGDRFYVKVKNTDNVGWVVTTAIVRLGDGNMPKN